MVQETRANNYTRYLPPLHEDSDYPFTETHEMAPRRRLGAVVIIAMNAALFLWHLLEAGNVDRLFPEDALSFGAPPSSSYNAVDVAVMLVTALWACRWYFSPQHKVRSAALVLLLVITLRVLFSIILFDPTSFLRSLTSEVLLYAMLPNAIVLRYRCLHPGNRSQSVDEVRKVARQFSLIVLFIVVAQMLVGVVVAHTNAGLAVPQALPSLELISSMFQGEVVSYANRGRTVHGLSPVLWPEVFIQIIHRVSSIIGVCAILLLFVFARQNRPQLPVFYGYVRWLCCTALLATVLGLAVVHSLLDSVWDGLHAVAAMAMLCFSVMAVLTSKRLSSKTRSPQ